MENTDDVYTRLGEQLVEEVLTQAGIAMSGSQTQLSLAFELEVSQQQSCLTIQMPRTGKSPLLIEVIMDDSLT